MEFAAQPNAAAAVELVATLIAHAVRVNPRPVLGLATGRTVEPVCARLVVLHRHEALDFSSCRTFNLDEYVGLSAHDPNAYRAYMNRHLFEKVNVNLQNTHVPDGMAADVNAECARYEQLITQWGGIDLQLLGIGLNGHIGFNEPPSEPGSLTHVQKLSLATLEQNAPLFKFPESMPRNAITMGIGTILKSRRCVLLATGSEKAEVVARMVEGPLTNAVPASVLQTHFNCVVVLDEAAASSLKEIVSSKSQGRNKKILSPVSRRAEAELVGDDFA
jgi:glucosamine-6-phosphate deaminase